MCRGDELLASKKDSQLTERLGVILRKLREKKGLTREELAERSETGLRHVAVIELGEKNSSVDTLYRLIRGIGFSLTEYFFLNDRQETQN